MKLNRLFIMFLFALCFFLFAQEVVSGEIYVSVTGDDLTGDGSPGNPYGTIQKGIDVAGVGDAVIIQDGTYTGVGNFDVDFNGKFITVRSENGAVNTIIDCQSNGRGFYFHSFELEASVLDGFTIQNGDATVFAENKYGGGIYCENAYPTVRNCVIQNNTAEVGGGVYGKATLVDCLITGNTATGTGIENTEDGGGGVAYANVVSYCTITSNTAQQSCGGGIYIAKQIEHSTISGNSATLDGFEKNGIGGGIANDPSIFSSSIMIKDCEISGNTAEKQGGGIGGGLVRVFATRVFGNSAPEGGGVFVTSWYQSLFINCLIYNNTATSGNGGGMVSMSGILKNCTVYQNTAAQDGGGISGSSTWFRVRVNNCIIWNNTAGGSGNQMHDETMVIASTSCIQDGFPGSDISVLDPQFVDPGVNDFYLSPASPCINAGSSMYAPLHDLDGNFRDHFPDLGAYEVSSGIQSLEINVSPSGSDTTGDGSAGDPFRTIQRAIDEAGTGDEVIVAAGTYTGTGNKNLDTQGKAITVRSQTGAESTIIDCQNDGRGFYIHNGETEGTVIDGFTIRNGNVNNGPDGVYAGGGIYCYSSNSPVIQNCIIKDNIASSDSGLLGTGGGISGGAIIRNCEITGNTAAYAGGGVYYATAVYDSIISNNTCSYLTASGGGISNCERIENCTVSGNHVYGSSASGGGVRVYEGIVKNCIISNNSAEGSNGGGIYISYGLVQNCRVFGNQTGAYGGGIYLSQSSAVNCLVYDNQTVTGSGGGINLFVSSWGTGYIRHCTVYNNTAANDGGGIDSDRAVSNSIVWGNTAITGENDQIDSNLDGTVSYSCVEGGYTGIGNFSDDPLFVDPGVDNFQLQPSSPCIDAGSPELGTIMDIDNNIRDSVPDVGAYEDSAVPLTYSITASASANGSIDPSGIVVLNVGDSREYLMVPDNGYEIDTVTVDSMDYGNIPSYTFWSVTEDHTIDVTFKVVDVIVDTYTISGAISGDIQDGVLLSLTGDAVRSVTSNVTGSYNFGGVLSGSYVVTPSLVGYTFTPPSSPVTVTASDVTSIDFTAEIAQYTITTAAGTNGSVSPSGDVTVNHGDSPSFAITPDTWYEIDEILLDGNPQTIADPFIITNVTADYTLQVTFIELPEYAITVNSGENGTVDPSGLVMVTETDSLSVVITPDDRYELNEILLDGVPQTAANPFVISNVTANHTLDVSFIQVPEYRITVIFGPYGKVLPSGNVIVYEGESASFIIVPDSGSKIDEILLDGEPQTLASPLDISNVTSDMILEVAFKKSSGSKGGGCAVGGLYTSDNLPSVLMLWCLFLVIMLITRMRIRS